jgi:hypothetical protein
VVELLRQGAREAGEQRHADARAGVVSDAPAPNISEFRGCLRLNRMATEWGATIGRDRDMLACAILGAYAAGEFDSVSGEVVWGFFDFEQLKPFSLGKDAARLLATRRTNYHDQSLMSLEYSYYVTGGLLYIRPEALALFAKQRDLLAMPDWLRARTEEDLKNPKGRGGKPPAADWPALQEALEREIDLVGLPRKDGPPGWRTTADVVHWLEERTGEDNPGKTALKDNAKRMLENIRERKAGNSRR